MGHRDQEDTVDVALLPMDKDPGRHNLVIR
jgi:hypothetical protein